MNIFQIFAIGLFCFILFQIYEFFINIDNIKNFNSNYFNLQFGSGNFVNIDTTVIDPNDFELNVKNKFRCELYDNLFVIISIKGFLSNNKLNLNLFFIDEGNCINSLFNLNNYILYDACQIDSNSKDCKFILSKI